MEIIEIKTHIPWPFFEVNSYLVGNGREYFLIDCGFYGDFENMWKKIKEYASKISLILLTHGHPDHYGNAIYIKENLLNMGRDVKVFVHRDDLDRVVMLPAEVRRKAAEVGMNYLIQNGAPEEKLQIIKEQTKYFKRTHQLKDEDIIHIDSFSVGGKEFKIIHTPGHTPGHIIIYCEDDGILFSGDHIISRGSAVNLLFFPTPSERFRNMVFWMKSLEIIKEISPRKVFGGHFDSFENWQEVLNRIKRRIEKMKGKVLEAVSEPKTIYEVGNIIYPDIPDEFWSFKFSEAQGYIDILEDEGLVKKVEVDGKIYFVKI